MQRYPITVSVFYLLGDIEKAEDNILNKYSGIDILESTIIKVSHHGSKTSSSEEFVQSIKPKIALIGVGENNKFGHPDEDVINRLKKLRLRNL